MTLVVNLYGGPGTGKSTTAALTFGELKSQDVNCEYVQEYAKDRVWDEHFSIFSNQIYLLGKQYHRMHRLLDKVDVIITDAPLLLMLHYGKDNTPQSFKQLVMDLYNSMNNMDIFLRRKKEYNPSGRMQTEVEAKAIDEELFTILVDKQVLYTNVDADRNAGKVISSCVLNRLSYEKATNA